MREKGAGQARLGIAMAIASSAGYGLNIVTAQIAPAMAPPT